MNSHSLKFWLENMPSSSQPDNQEHRLYLLPWDTAAQCLELETLCPELQEGRTIEPPHASLVTHHGLAVAPMCPQPGPSMGSCQFGLSLQNSAPVQPALSLLQMGSFNPSYDKIFSHLQDVKYKGEWSWDANRPLLERDVVAPV